MKYLARYINNIGSVLSIAINVIIFLGAPSEAFSERCGRHQLCGISNFFGVYVRKCIDTIFFFDYIIDEEGKLHKHCAKAYLYETTGEVIR